jgi:hypothetical protein
MCKTRPKCSRHIKPCRPRPPPPPPRPPVSQLNELNVRVQQLNNQLQAKSRQQEELSRQLTDCVGDNTRLKQNAARLTAERNTLRQQVNQGRAQCSALEAKLRESSIALTNTMWHNQELTANLLEELGEQKKFVSAQKKRIANLQREISLLKQQAGGGEDTGKMTQLKSQLAKSQGEVALLRQGLKAIGADLKETQDALHVATTERNEARAALAQMTASRDMWQAVAALAIGANVSLTANNAELRIALQKQRENTKKLNANLSRATSKIKALGCENTNLTQLNQSLQAEANEVNRQRLQEQRSAMMEQQDLRLRLEESQQTNKQLATFYEGVVAGLQAERENLEKENRDAKQLVEATMRMLTQAQSERDSFKQQAEEEPEDAIVDNEVSSVLQAEIDALRGENQALKADVQKMDSQITSITAEREKALKELEELKDALVGLISVLLDRNGAAVTMPSFDHRNQKVVVENERWYPFPFSTWSKKLLPTDRACYTLIDGKTPCDAPEAFPLGAGEKWSDDVAAGWRVASLGSPDGWLYAVDFPTTHYTENFPTACVRRRIHVRAFTLVSIERPKDPCELGLGGRLVPGGQLVSPSGQYRCVLQGDGNVVLYNGSKALWSSKTCGNTPRELVFQSDGNLVLYGGPSGTSSLWSTGTSNKSAHRLLVQDDGNLVVYNTNGKAIWTKS